MNLTPPFGPVKKYATRWPELFEIYRTVIVRGDEITHGLLRPELGSEHPEVISALREWEGTHFVFPRPQGVEITLVRRIAPPRRERWWLHLLLGLLTLLTTTIAGASLAGFDPVLFTLRAIGPIAIPIPTHLDVALLPSGLLFSVPLMIALFGHEMGHYVMTRRHRIDTSPPYFIPTPHWFNLIGTFGAFIRLRSVIVNRISLIDVGMAGPLMSFIISLPLVAAGLAMSTPVAATGMDGRYLIVYAGQPIEIGGSIIFRLIDALILTGDGPLLLHPLAFAGWLGFFVTALNLFPLSQLDGGHILYGLVGRYQRFVALGFLLLLVALGFNWWGWWLWAGVILVIGRGSVGHPPVFDPEIPVTGFRRALGWSCVAIFILTFMAVPISI